MATHLLTDEEWDTIMLATRITASLSMICAVITIVTYFRWRQFRTTVSGIVCLLAASDILSMIAYTIGRYTMDYAENSFLCQMQGLFVQIGDLSAILWTGCIAMDLLLVMFYGRSISQVNKLHTRYYVPICITIALAAGLIPLAFSEVDGVPFYGHANLWCWISKPYNYFQLILLYGPLWVVFLFNAGVYIAVGRMIWQHSKLTEAQISRREPLRYKYSYLKNVTLYLIAFIITWFIPTANRIKNVVNPNNQSFALFLLHGVLLSSNGILNCIAYFYVAWISRIVTSHGANSRSAPTAIGGGNGGGGNGNGVGGSISLSGKQYSFQRSMYQTFSQLSLNDPPNYTYDDKSGTYQHLQDAEDEEQAQGQQSVPMDTIISSETASVPRTVQFADVDTIRPEQPSPSLYKPSPPSLVRTLPSNGLSYVNTIDVIIAVDGAGGHEVIREQSPSRPISPLFLEERGALESFPDV